MTQTRQISKIWPEQIYILCSSLRISGHLPAPTVNVGDRLGKLQFSELQKPRELTLTLYRVIQHTVVHHSSTSIYIPNFIEIGRTFCGRMYVRTDGHTDWRTFQTPLMLLGQLRGALSQPKNSGIYIKQIHTFSCLNRVKIFISRRVLWQYVWCSKGEIFFMATFVFNTWSNADLFTSQLKQFKQLIYTVLSNQANITWF